MCVCVCGGGGGGSHAASLNFRMSQAGAFTIEI